MSARLLAAAKVYAFNYCQDEAEDEEDCVCGPKQHAEAKELFAAIAEAEAAPLPAEQPSNPMADRARQPVAGSVDTPEFRELVYRCGRASNDENVARTMGNLIAHINALIAPAAPSGEAVAYADPMAFLNFRTAACTKEWMWAKPDAGLVPLYTHPAPRDVDAPIVLPEKPEPTINGTVYHEEHKICYTAPVHYTAVQMDAHATAAVQKDRASKGTK